MFRNLFGRRFGKRFFSNNVQKIEIITKHDKKKWYRKISERPFKNYFRMSGITFGICFAMNSLTSLVDNDRRYIISNNPDIFALSVFGKSCYFGLLWPSFYIKSFFYPREVFYLYGGVENTIKFGENIDSEKKLDELYADNKINKKELNTLKILKNIFEKKH
tara:strand:- start:984 stop:1469 length:486 start_codon:yes stop_codon:yes gene_type:complete